MSYWVWSPLLPGGAALAETFSATLTDSCALGATDTYYNLARTDYTFVILGLTEGTPVIVVVLTVSDGCAIQETDATTLITILLTSADSLAVQATDATPLIAASVVASDSCGYTASDAVNISSPRAITVADSLSLTASDASLTLIASVVVSDSLLVQVSDATPAMQALLSVADGAAVQADDSATPAVDTGSTLVSKSFQPDLICAIQVDDAVIPALAVQVGASDTCAAVAADTIDITVPRALNATDTLVVQAAESAPTQFFTVAAVESLAVVVTDAASILAPTSATDTCAIQASDAAPNIVQSASISAADSFAIQASEAAPIIGQAFLTADSLAVSASDAINTGTARAVSAQDDLAVQQTDATANSLQTAVSDTAPLGLDEQPAIFCALTVSDSCTLGLTDTVAFAGELIILVTKHVTDAVLLNVEDLARTPVLPAEVVAMLLLESVSVKVTWVEVWGGGMRAEDAYHIYATSVRMGPLPPDQNRGGIW